MKVRIPYLTKWSGVTETSWFDQPVDLTLKGVDLKLKTKATATKNKAKFHRNKYS